MHKRIYTLHFERSSNIDSVLMKKLTNAMNKSAIVVSTPASVKSLLLKLIEAIVIANDPSDKRAKEIQKQIKAAPPIFDLLKSGYCLIDEVDVVLHPLKSELNFPIGRKEDLDFSPERWNYPTHLLDALFAASGTAEALVTGEEATDILNRLRAVLEEGYVICVWVAD